MQSIGTSPPRDVQVLPQIRRRSDVELRYVVRSAATALTTAGPQRPPKSSGRGAEQREDAHRADEVAAEGLAALGVQD